MKLTDHGCTNLICTRFFINTDFKLWIKFPDILRQMQTGDLSGYKKIFVSEIPMPTPEIIEGLCSFYHTPSEIPRVQGNSDRVLDYDIDAPYIYAAFMQAYGIDLLDENLHWHKFQALLNSLPEDTMLVKIMQYRSYSGSSKDPGYKDYMELKRMWELPLEVSETEKKALEEFNNL